jgi:hypothetical protein
MCPDPDRLRGIWVLNEPGLGGSFVGQHELTLVDQIPKNHGRLWLCLDYRCGGGNVVVYKFITAYSHLSYHKLTS